MARFGTGIQAGLGAINYAPYMQGAVAGSQSIAQGIAALGQAAGGAINTYYAKKEEEDKKQKATSAFIKTIEANPAAFQTYFKDGNLDKDAVRAVVDVLGFQGTIQLNSYLAESAKQQKAETERLASKRDEDQVNELLQAESTGMLDQVISKATPAARAKFEQVRQQQQTQGVQLDLARSEIAKNLAQARATGMPKPEDLTFQEQTLNEAVKAEEVRLGRKLTPAESFDVRKMVIGLTGQKGTTINMPGEDKTSENLYKNLQTERTASIQPIIDADSINSTLNDLLKNPDLITGKTAQAELFVKSIGNDLGITDFKDVENTQLFISLVGQRIKSSIKAFGSATAVSDGDRIYTEKIEGGDITSQLEGIKQLQTILNDQARKKINNFNKRVERVFPDQGRYKAALIVSEEEAPFTLQQQPDYIYRGGRLIQNSNK